MKTAPKLKIAGWIGLVARLGTRFLFLHLETVIDIR